MIKSKIIKKLQQLTNHDHLEITSRGNAAIKAALSVTDKKVLIPEEGGWLSYKTIPLELKQEVEEVRCSDAKINLLDLEKKLHSEDPGAFLYQNPGGYFAEQPLEEIYQLCQENGCLVVLDVSGAIGTRLCDGNYADIIVGSFSKWKLVDAGKGGFISCRDERVWNRVKDKVNVFDDEIVLDKILEKLNGLKERISELTKIKNEVVSDLNNFDIVHPDDLGFVVVVKFATEQERKRIIYYCRENSLEWTECPRYIRLNKKAISIEVKRL